jgi:hypothetical protein
MRSSLDNLRAGLFYRWEATLLEGGKGPGELAFVLGFLQHLDNSRGIYRALIGRESGSICERYIRTMLRDMVRQDMSSRPRDLAPDIPPEAVEQYVVGALMALISWWIDYEIALSAEDVNKIFLRMTLGGLTTDH